MKRCDVEIAMCHAKGLPASLQVDQSEAAHAG